MMPSVSIPTLIGSLLFILSPIEFWSEFTTRQAETRRRPKAKENHHENPTHSKARNQYETQVILTKEPEFVHDAWNLL